MVDPKVHMVLTMQQWNKIVEELQKLIHVEMPRNGKKCEDKWNGLNFDYKKLLDYHKGIGYHTSLLELTMEEHNKFKYINSCVGLPS